MAYLTVFSLYSTGGTEDQNGRFPSDFLIGFLSDTGQSLSSSKFDVPGKCPVRISFWLFAILTDFS